MPQRVPMPSHVAEKRSATIPSAPTIPSTAMIPSAPRVKLDPPQPENEEAPPSSGRRRDTSPSSSGFAATIDGATIADLVQLECLRGLTRAVRVIREGGDDGVLYFDQGQVVHAETALNEGNEAALSILSWEGGRVEPCAKYWVEPPTITMGWQGLLMAAATRFDEESRPESETAIPVHTSEKEWSELEEQEQSLPAGITKSVRMASDGGVIETSGEMGDFPDAVSYTLRLAQLIGEGLGLEGFRGYEATGPKTTVIVFSDEEGGHGAVEADAGADLSEYKRKAGL